LAVLVAGAVGFFAGQWRGSSTTRESVGRRADRREALLVEAIGDKDRSISACRQVIRRATRVIRARSGFIENLYEDMLDNVRRAYELGVAGDEDELQLGLGRAILESSQLEQFAASEMAANGWTGWAHADELAACEESVLRVPVGRRPDGSPLYVP
jgi:hypothetical protein